MSLANRISKYPRISTTERIRRSKHDLPEIEAIREEAGSDSFEIDLISLFDSWNSADSIPWHTKAISLRTFQKKYFDAFKVSSGLLKDEQAEARKKLLKNDIFSAMLGSAFVAIAVLLSFFLPAPKWGKRTSQ